ncbi:MAG: phosphoribosyltransferase family protein [Candidatus Thorarchaeota archaeon]|jgi:adenine phosphoribosyltransferase
MTDVDFLEYVEVIKDHPEPGKAVCDISRLLEHPTVFHEAVVALAKPLVELQPNKVIGIEQKGLALGSAIAYYLGCGVVPARSIAFIPEEYSRPIELLPSSRFADQRLALVSESIDVGDRVAIVDDWLIQGTTVMAVQKAIEKLGAQVVGIVCVINNLSETRRKLLGRPEVHSLIENLVDDSFIPSD